MTERWLPVLDYEGLYEVSDLGRVRSLARTNARGQAVPSRVRKVSIGTWGYALVQLHRDGQPRTHPVHKLVLEAFVGKRPDKLQCCHCDGVRHNNALSNLRWDTPAANSADRLRHRPSGFRSEFPIPAAAPRGKRKRGPQARTPTGDRIFKYIRAGKLTPNQIAKLCGVTASAVRYYKRMFARGLAK